MLHSYLVFGKNRNKSVGKCFMVLHILKLFCPSSILLPFVADFQIVCLLLRET